MSYSSNGSGGGVSVPSENIFDSVADRDTYFNNNATLLFEGVACVILTNPPEGLYQVYSGTDWQDRSIVVIGPRGVQGVQGDLGQLQSVTIDGDDFVFVDSSSNEARLIDAVPQLKVEASGLRHDELTNRDLANQHPISSITNLQEFLNGKEDAVIGKQLSDENYTLLEKTKLAGIDDALALKVNSDDTRLTDSRDWIAEEVELEEAQLRLSGTYRKWSALRVGQAIVAWWEATGNQATLDDLISSGDLEGALEGKVDKVAGFGLSQANFTQAEKDKLATLEDSKFKGLYKDLAALQAAHPTADAGSYAFIDGTEGNPNQLYVWAATEWEIVGGDVVSLTPSQVKQLLLENADTNNFSDSDKQKLEDAVTQEELASELTGYAATVHNHSIAQVTGLQDELDGKAASAHGHAITDVSGLQSALDNKAADSHGHSISQVTGLNDALSNKVDKVTGKGLSTNDLTSDLVGEIGKVKDKVDKVAGKGLSTNDYDDTAQQAVDSLGSAATRDVTTSRTDTTEGRLLKVGDFGVGSGFDASLTDYDVRMPTGFYGYSNTATPSPGEGWRAVLNIVDDSGGGFQLAGRTVNNDFSIRSVAAGGAVEPFVDLHHTGNLKKATNDTLETNDSDYMTKKQVMDLLTAKGLLT